MVTRRGAGRPRTKRDGWNARAVREAIDRARIVQADVARGTKASDSSVSCYLIGQTFPPRWWRTLAYAYLIWRGAGVSAEDMGLARYGDAELSRLTAAVTRDNRERWKACLRDAREQNRA